jgi:hypothetical protein
LLSVSRQVWALILAASPLDADGLGDGDDDDEKSACYHSLNLILF